LNDWKDTLFAELLPHVRTPAQYVGGEWNMVRKDPAAVALRFCLVFPDTYAVGMSYSGLPILYGTLNERPDVYCERAFAPWTDMQEMLRRRNVPLCSLETFTPLSRFDLVGFSLQYEMTYTNVLDTLELGGIPLLTRDRAPQHPLIVAGGPCTANPEPMGDFVDLFILGDGEERIHDLAAACIAVKQSPCRTREEQLIEIVQRVPNAYAPSLYEPEWLPDGRLRRIAPRAGLEGKVPPRVLPAVVSDLDRAYLPARPLVPYVEIIHDRISIEIMRGCTRGCRYCQAGMTRRPVRCRSVETILRAAEQQYAATGCSEINLSSLSSSDYPDLKPLVRALAQRFGPRGVGLSLPSLRVNDQLQQLPALLNDMKRSTLTLAPEAGTERLRRIINKDIRDDDLLRGVEAAYANGWTHVKLYFMAGLPTESDDDLLAITRLAEEVSQMRRKTQKGLGRVNVSVAGFVPKAHTPFERDAMVPRERLQEISLILRRSVRNRNVMLRMHNPQRSFLEGVFARGDRRLGRVLLEAHRRGCRLDAWDEVFNFDAWMEAFAAAGVEPEFHALRARDSGETLPWSHLRDETFDRFLVRERERAAREEFTPDCRTDRCQGCGAACPPPPAQDRAACAPGA